MITDIKQRQPYRQLRSLRSQRACYGCSYEWHVASRGVIPYGGTLVFTDYCRPSIRLSALMKLRVIYVMTHDSIGLGEDGPTHQPVEHLSAQGRYQTLTLIRPADAVWKPRVGNMHLRPAKPRLLIAPSRQNLPLVRHGNEAENLCSREAIIKRSSQQDTKVTIVATGSEVSIAVERTIKTRKRRYPDLCRVDAMPR